MNEQYALGYKAGLKAAVDACRNDGWNAFADLIAALPVPEVQCCNWTQDYNDAEQGAWKTDCDEYWYIIDGSPSYNNMKFCHGCGKPIAEHPYVEAEESE